MRLPGLVLTFALFAFLVPTATAAGAAPERYTFEDVFSDTIDCSTFNPAWTFNDDFVDFFTGRGQVWLDAAGEPIRAIEHVVHRSTTSTASPASRCTSTTTSSRRSTSYAGP